MKGFSVPLLLMWLTVANLYENENLRQLVQKYSKSPELKKVIDSSKHQNQSIESRNDMDSLKQLWKEKKFKSYENVQYRKEEKEEAG